MTAELKQLVTSRDDYKASAKSVLQAAGEQELVAVIIVGVKADGTAWCRASNTENTLEFLGAIEWAKEHTLKHWE